MFLFTIWLGLWVRLRAPFPPPPGAEGNEPGTTWGFDRSVSFSQMIFLPLLRWGVAEQTFHLTSLHLALVHNDIFLCVLFLNHFPSLCRPPGLARQQEEKG